MVLTWVPVGIFDMRYLVFTLLLISSPFAWSQIGTYQTLQAFLAESFDNAPDNQTLWLNAPVRAELGDVLDRPFRGLRLRYWSLGDRTAWVLNEIGKERPITTAIAVEDGKIVAMSVLEYRESRGGEVRLPSFRRQFLDAALNQRGKLNQRIQGITGATLSVQTLNRSAVAALKLHEFAMARNLGHQPTQRQLLEGNRKISQQTLLTLGE